MLLKLAFLGTFEEINIKKNYTCVIGQAQSNCLIYYVYGKIRIIDIYNSGLNLFQFGASGPKGYAANITRKDLVTLQICNYNWRAVRHFILIRLHIEIFTFSNFQYTVKGIIKLCSKCWMSSRFRKCCTAPIFRKEIMWKCIHLNFFRHHYALFAIQNRVRIFQISVYFTFVRGGGRLFILFTK